MTKQPTTDSPGVIEPANLYTLCELKKRTRLGDWAIRKARKDGLRVRKIGNARFAFGADFLKHVEAIGEDSE